MSCLVKIKCWQRRQDGGTDAASTSPLTACLGGRDKAVNVRRVDPDYLGPNTFRGQLTILDPAPHGGAVHPEARGRGGDAYLVVVHIVDYIADREL